MPTFIAINWGSSTFAAYLISDAAGIVDHYKVARGVTRLDRDGMAATFAEALARWPRHERVYCSGMIGSNVGWTEAPYLACPASLSDVAQSLVPARIANVECHIVPGLATLSADGDPDVLRGEEMEIFGLLAARGARDSKDRYLVLPGTHTKWVRVCGERVTEFVTSMSGELFDRLAAQSLLSSVLDDHTASAEDASFARGVQRGAAEGGGIGRLLFGVRAQVLRGALERRHAASYARGLLIGAEIADVLRLYPQLKREGELPLLGNPALCTLYHAALATFGIDARIADSSASLVAGYRALDAEVRACRV